MNEDALVEQTAGSFRYAGFLTEAPRPEVYACCAKCLTLYVDDDPRLGSLSCPDCDQALVRGVGVDRAVRLVNADGKYRLRPQA